MQIFTQIRQEIRNVQVEIRMRPKVKYDCQWAKFQEIHIQFVAFCK